MDDSLLVRHHQGRGQLRRDGHRGRHPELPAGVQQVPHGDALDVLHREVVDALPLAEVVRADDVPVRDPAGQPDLVLEPLHRGVVYH